MMMIMIMWYYFCCAECDGRVCADRADVSQQGTGDVYTVLSLSVHSVFRWWLEGLYTCTVYTNV